MLTGERQFTVADLENFPEDGNRYEVIDGELYVTAAVTQSQNPKRFRYISLHGS